MEWIPIKTRPMTEEEKKHYKDYYIEGYITEMYDCELPDDGEEVLITTLRGYVTTDRYEKIGFDIGYFQSFCDEGEVVAWMPLPEPYKE